MAKKKTLKKNENKKGMPKPGGKKDMRLMTNKKAKKKIK
jgi:hypothetical protein